MSEIEDIIEQYHSLWKKAYNILSVRKAIKFTNGLYTGIPCITFYVSRKIKDVEHSSTFRIPTEIAGIPTDVVELSTSDYKLGETSVSKETTEQQRRRASGIKE